MTLKETNEETATVLAFAALGWVLNDGKRATRLLSLTGLTPDDLRDRLTEPALLAAVLRFLEGHEPDLIGCAEAIGAEPEQLVEARRRLEE